MTRGIRRAVVWMTAGLLVLPAGWGAASARARQGGDRSLAFFEPASGTLDDQVPGEEWNFDGTAGQVIAVLAVTTRGDLDPEVQIVTPDGLIAAENDDLDSLVHDAGLEGIALETTGRYTIRVQRYLLAEGKTSGDYELTVTPGYARVAFQSAFSTPDSAWVTPQGETLPLAQERLAMRVTNPGAMLTAYPPEPPRYDDFYAQVDARLFASPSYAEFGFVLRAQGPDLVRSYQFKLNTLQQWRVLYQDETGVYALRTWSPAEGLTPTETAWTLSVLARGADFAFYVNGTLFGTVSDDRLTTAGQIGLLVASGDDQTDPATVLYDNVIVTARLGTTYKGLPLALRTWNSRDPAVVVNELAESGQMTPQPARDLFLPEKSLMATDRTSVFELVGSDRAIYDDFVLSADVSILTPSGDAGCGLAYRWQDAGSMDLAYVDTAGGFGVVQTRDGELVTNVYDESPMVTGEPNRLLIVAQGERVALYINGALVTQETVQPGRGRTGVALLNYAATRTDCFWSDLWVWPLQP